MARDECWDALKEHARQNHRERVAKNPDRIEYAIRQLEAHNIEYVLKNDATAISTAAVNPTTHWSSSGRALEKSSATHREAFTT